MSPLLQEALNGARPTIEHPAIPGRPDELAQEARASVDAGAQVVHLHAYDPSGIETLAPGSCAATLRAVRAVCPCVPISLTTSAAIESDPIRRLELIASCRGDRGEKEMRIIARTTRCGGQLGRAEGTGARIS
jgi:uncharacterized protein (DUF849 family)